MASFFAAYWIVWAFLLAYVVRLGRRQRRLDHQVASLHAILQQRHDGNIRDRSAA